MSWSLGLHFVDVSYSLVTPNIISSVIGVLGAFASGYVIGWVFAYVWEWLEKRK